MIALGHRKQGLLDLGSLSGFLFEPVIVLIALPKYDPDQIVEPTFTAPRMPALHGSLWTSAIVKNAIEITARSRRNWRINPLRAVAKFWRSAFASRS
jgi:hypothetical protein